MLTGKPRLDQWKQHHRPETFENANQLPVALDLQRKLGKISFNLISSKPDRFWISEMYRGRLANGENRSMSGETPGPHERLRKSTTLDLLVLRTHGLAMICQLVSSSTKNRFDADATDLFSEWKRPVRSKEKSA